ncbi:MAG: ATP synthase subunit I [Deltaproteobacteria bacterium]
MNETLTLTLAWGAGGALGALFYGGLWWTVKTGLSSSLPALWFSVSLLLRSGLALSGFYFVGGGHWQRLLACFLGFFIARRVVTALTRPSGEVRRRPVQESSRAP